MFRASLALEETKTADKCIDIEGYGCEKTNGELSLAPSGRAHTDHSDNGAVTSPTRCTTETDNLGVTYESGVSQQCCG